MTTWFERLHEDDSVQAFVSAETAPAGIEVVTVRWQRARLATSIDQLDKAHAIISTLRCRFGRGRRLESEGIS